MTQPPSEFQFIESMLSDLSKTFAGAHGLKDDVCFIPPADKGLIITKDMLVENVHFFGDDPADLIARKAIRANISDLAAKGAKPFGFFCAAALPDWANTAWLTKFVEGLKQDSEFYGLHVLGGDTTKGKTLTISITMLGYGDNPPRRSDAKVGDDIYITGQVGLAALGLRIWQTIKAGQGGYDTLNGYEKLCADRYLLPDPQPDWGIKLRPFMNASMDISDGLAQDLEHICRHSHVAAEIFWEQIRACTVDEAHDATVQTAALTGGDDYTILFTADADKSDALRVFCAENSIFLTKIGKIISPKPENNDLVAIFDSRNQTVSFTKKGYVHKIS